MDIIDDFKSLLIFLIICIFILYMIYKSIMTSIDKAAEQHKQKIQTVKATLISKRMDTIITDYFKSTCRYCVIYYLVFKLENEEKIQFQVKPENYAVILKGNIGKLTYKGNEFIGFYIEKISESNSK